MLSKGNESSVDYISRGIEGFHELMSSNSGKILESLNRVNKGELFVLYYLTLRNTEVLPTELSEALRSTTGRMSALLGALEKKGYIERNTDKNNRRNVLVTITDAGREQSKTEMEIIYEIMSKTLGKMGETDTLEFLRLAKKFFSIAEEYFDEL